MVNCQKAYETLKLKLMTALVLGLPDFQQGFKLCVHERQGLVLGMGDIPQSVACLSKQLDSTANGWLPA